MSREYLRRIGLPSSATEKQIENRMTELIRKLQNKLNSPVISHRDQIEKELEELFQIRAALRVGNKEAGLQDDEENSSSDESLEISYGELTEGLGIEENCEPSTSNVGLLIDTSGSMSGTKLKDAKIALESFLSNLDGNQIMVGLAEFGNTISVVSDQTSELDRVRSSIGELVCGGSTPLYETLELASSKWSSFLGQSFLFIVATDGHPNGSTERILSLAEEIKERGVRFITIGIGSDVNVKFLQDLASTPEDYYFAEASIQLESIYRQISDGLASLD